MRFVSTFDRHRKEPGKSLPAYAKERRLQLGKDIAERHKIYLDTKYWVLLRDHKLNRLASSTMARLSDLLHEGVRSRRLICPISGDVFAEILKQEDPATLQASVDLIDVLSEGVSTLARSERVRMELLYFTLTGRPDAVRYYPPETFVWTKLAYVLGFATPTRTPFPPEEDLMLQKAFLDQMWEMSLSDMINTLGADGVRQIPQMPDASEDLNRGKLSERRESPSLNQVILSEIAGLLSILESDVREMFTYLYKEKTGGARAQEDGSAAVEAREFMDLVYDGFRLKRFSTELPCLRIPATLHAAILCDPGRRYKKGDLTDIDHAETALPYFDMFLTEHSLRHLLTRSDLALDRLYDCIVISQPEDAVREIERILSQEAASPR